MALQRRVRVHVQRKLRLKLSERQRTRFFLGDEHILN